MADERSKLARDLDLDRFLTFLDAIVAIAITLLVLPLIELPAHVDEYHSVGALVRKNQAEIWAFLLSFIVVSRFWFAQRRVVRRMVGFHERIALLLMLWALTIVFLAFPTGLVAEDGSSAVTKVLYIGTMVLSTSLVAAVQLVLARRTDLTDGEPIDPSSAIANALMLALALAITLVLPATSYYPLLLLLVADPAATGWQRWRGRAASMTTS